MGSDLDLHGVYVPLVTPFTSEDDVALDEIDRLAHEYLDAGAAGIVALGTTGEPATLEAGERQAVIETVGAVCRERSAQFLVGAGGNSTRAAIVATREAALAPRLTAVLSVVPYYTRPTEEGIVAHFEAIAAESPVPLVLYNIPYRTGRNLGARSLLELAEVPNIAGLKQAVGGVDTDTLALMASKPDDFHVLCGDDPFVYSLMCLGGSGAIAASSHVCTQGFVDVVDAALKDDHDTARELAAILLPVCKALFAEPSPAVIKGVLAAQGRISTDALRSPMTPATTSAVEAAIGVVNEAERALSSRTTR